MLAEAFEDIEWSEMLTEWAPYIGPAVGVLVVGMVLVITLFVGSAFGAITFLKRRKHLRALFTDAGGMLRLDIEPLPGTSVEGRLLKGAGDRSGYAQLSSGR